MSTRSWKELGTNESSLRPRRAAGGGEASILAMLAWKASWISWGSSSRASTELTADSPGNGGTKLRTTAAAGPSSALSTLAGLGGRLLSSGLAGRPGLEGGGLGVTGAAGLGEGAAGLAGGLGTGDT